MYNGKIEVVSFATKSGKKLTIGVKCMVNVKKWDRGSSFCFFRYLNIFVIYQ
jgi:hypothetical protein